MKALVAVVFWLSGAGCVFPMPPPGDPVPGLSITLSGTSPYSGTLTISVAPFNYSPASVRFHLDGATTPTFVDSSAPFEYDLDTTAITDGTHKVSIRASDSTYTVIEKVQFVTRNDPNIVMIMVDDLDLTTTPFWDAMPQTRALVADQGIEFTNAFATDPTCCPARATMLTGRYPHNTGVFDNTSPDGGFPAFVASGAEADTLATRLDAAGYDAALIGKYLNEYSADPTHLPPGWDEWFALVDGWNDGYSYRANRNGVIETYGSDPDDYLTDVLATEALAYVDAQESSDDRPFMLWLAPSAPHAPLPPAPRHTINEFTDDPIPPRPNFGEVDVSDKPTWLRDGVSQITFGIAASMTNDYRDRMGALLAVDEMIAALFARLSANGELSETVVLFISDNGYNLGSHRLSSKRAPYEESIRVPFLMAGPGIAAGGQTDGFVTHADIAPTVLDLAGLPWSDTDGRSLEPLFDTSPAPSWRTDFLVEYKGTYFPLDEDLDTLAQVQAAIQAGSPMKVPTYRAVRNEQYLYVEWYSTAPHEYELYDMVADPYQLDNLVATPEGAALHEPTTTVLQARLEELGSCAAATCRT